MRSPVISTVLVDFLFDAEVMFLQKYLLNQIRGKGVFSISRWAFQ
jgi:hypothetical protein